MMTNASQRGSALILVLFLSVVVSAIGATLLMTSGSDHRLAANERDAERALYAAHAGINYAYDLYAQNLLAPTEAGSAFNSFATAVDAALNGGEFTGALFDISAITGSSLYRIESTGTFGNATRTVELTFQKISDVFRYGYVGFEKVTLHNHSGYAGPDFRIESTILTNGDAEVPEDVTIDGAIVALGDVKIKAGAVITGGIFANKLENAGTVQGSAKMLTSVERLPDSATTWNRLDNEGNKYAWYDGNSTPGAASGNAALGGTTSYTIQNGEAFDFELFTRTGTLLPSPNVNVNIYAKAPLLDYAAMYAEALKNDMTYFATAADAMNYFITKKVVETIGGRTMTSIRVGTPAKPEFIYVDDDFEVTLAPGGGDDPGTSTLDADGLFIEGGLYVSGNFNFDGPNMVTAVPAYPVPPNYYMLSINALPYCYPALLVYAEPASGVITDWEPSDTPAIGGGPNLDMKAEGDEGPVYWNGVIYNQGDVHLHHTKDAKELIRMNGAELGGSLHNCDFLAFTYDPKIQCTKFLTTDGGTAEVVAYREIR